MCKGVSSATDGLSNLSLPLHRPSGHIAYGLLLRAVEHVPRKARRKRTGAPRRIGVVVRRTCGGDQALSEVEAWSAHVKVEVEFVGKHGAMLRAHVARAETASRRCLVPCPPQSPQVRAEATCLANRLPALLPGLKHARVATPPSDATETAVASAVCFQRRVGAACSWSQRLLARWSPAWPYISGATH